MTAVGTTTRSGEPPLAAAVTAVALSALLQVGGVLLGPLRTLLGTVPPGVPALPACAAVAALPGLVLRLTRRAGDHPKTRDQRPGGRVPCP